VANTTHGTATDAAPPSGPATLEVEGVSKSFGEAAVLHSVDLRVERGSMMALLGPSGCGKTTLLRSIAGLERPDEGVVRIDGRVVVGPGMDVAPERRRIGMVFQDWALFPHLSVADNVGYGLSRDERRSGRVTESLDLVGLGGFDDRMPSTLSGGQQQRVALARALAPRPTALLLDEPFSNLDTTLRVQVRTEVHRLLAGLDITTVFVTHDQEEAFVLGDRVAVMTGGRIVQEATPAEIYDEPVSQWVSGFVGEANLFDGHGEGSAARTRLGHVTLRRSVEGDCYVLFRPEQLAVNPPSGAEEPGSVAVVEAVEFYGHDHIAIVRFDDGQEARIRSTGPPRVSRGDQVAVTPSAAPTVAFSRGG
jgi:iron(III) transport system ATP-binding protein